MTLDSLYTQEDQVFDPHDVEYNNYAKSFADKEKLLIEHREQDRHVTKFKAPIETKDDRAAKEIINAYKKFGVENANPTRAIMRKTGVSVAQANQLVG